MTALGASRAPAQDPYETLAAQLTEAVQHTGAKSSQFLPLVSAAGKITPEGRMLSAKLLKYLVQQKRTVFVLGTLPESVVEPYTALLDEFDGQQFRQRLAPERAVPAEVVVLGSYMIVRDRIKTNLQAVEVASGKIIFASETDFRNEWEAMTELWPVAAAVKSNAALMPAPREPGKAPLQEKPVELVLPKMPAAVIHVQTLGSAVSSAAHPSREAQSNAAEFDALSGLLLETR